MAQQARGDAAGGELGAGTDAQYDTSNTNLVDGKQQYPWLTAWFQICIYYIYFELSQISQSLESVTLFNCELFGNYELLVKDQMESGTSCSFRITPLLLIERKKESQTKGVEGV